MLWRLAKPITISRSGLKLTVSSESDWDVFSEIWVSGAYDEPILEALRNSPIDAPATILDLGANVGLFSLRCMELASLSQPNKAAAIIAVEGVPRVFRMLKANLCGQNSCCRVASHLGVVGETTGTTMIYDTWYSGANGKVPRGGRVSRIPLRGAYAVETVYVNLETILPPNVTIDLLKCDIEGAEEVFLRNYPRLLERTRRMVIEFHPLTCDPLSCRRILSAAGFHQQAVLRTTATTQLEMYLACR